MEIFQVFLRNHLKLNKGFFRPVTALALAAKTGLPGQNGAACRT
jgi:hypothetical protein